MKDMLFVRMMTMVLIPVRSGQGGVAYGFRPGSVHGRPQSDADQGPSSSESKFIINLRTPGYYINSNTPAVHPSRDRRLTRDIYDVFAQTRRDAMNSGPQTSSSREVEAFHVENHGRDSNTTNIKRR